MSEDTDNVTAEAASAETQTMAEWLHAYYLKALFAEGINGWEHSMVHGHGRYLRTIPALEGKIFSETDAKRLGIWLKDVFPNVIASIGVDVRSNQLVIAMPGKTMDTWARDGLIGASHAGQLIALEHPAPEIPVNDGLVLARETLFSPSRWHEPRFYTPWLPPKKFCTVSLTSEQLQQLGMDAPQMESQVRRMLESYIDPSLLSVTVTPIEDSAIELHVSVPEEYYEELAKALASAPRPRPNVHQITDAGLLKQRAAQDAFRSRNFETF